MWLMLEQQPETQNSTHQKFLQTHPKWLDKQQTAPHLPELTGPKHPILEVDDT